MGSYGPAAVGFTGPATSDTMTDVSPWYVLPTPQTRRRPMAEHVEFDMAEVPKAAEEHAAKAQTITFEEFYAKYKPLHTEHGDLRQFEPRTDDPVERAMIEQAIAENRLWTYHHGEYDSVYFANGPHFVNRLDYVICEVPYGADEVIYAEDPDHQPHWYCEWCHAEYDEVTRERYDELAEGIPCGAEGCTGDPDREED